MSMISTRMMAIYVFLVIFSLFRSVRSNILVYDEGSYTSGGWTNDRTHDYSGGRLHGVFSSGNPSSVYKDIGLAGHVGVRVTLRFWAVDSWDHEYAYVWLDGNLKFSRQRTAYQYCNNGFSYYPHYVYAPWGNVKCYIDVDVYDHGHTSSTLRLQAGSNINGYQTDEWWGFSHVRVYLLDLVCPSGRYNSGSSCSNCPTGKYQNQNHQTSCKSCPSGQYQNSNGQSGCKNCPTGQYQNENQKTGCKACSSGYYQNSNGQTGCKGCPTGQYQDSNGQSGCKCCGTGQYQNQNVASGCKNCPTGKSRAKEKMSPCRS